MLELSEDQLNWLEANIPDAPLNPKGGRPTMNKRQAIQGIFWILDNGAKWKNLPQRYGSKSTVHRWFKRWVEDGVFETILNKAGKQVERQKGFKLYECFVDGSFSKAKGGGDGIGKTKAGKGVKIMIMVDARGLPIAARSMEAGPHECQEVQRLFEFMISSEKPHCLIGDKAYDSDKLDQELAQEGVEMIAPHRSNRKYATQDGRPLRRYQRRWTVERTIGWLQHFRRLCIRWEKSQLCFQGFLNLACSILLLKEVLG